MALDLDYVHNQHQKQRGPGTLISISNFSRKEGIKMFHVIKGNIFHFFEPEKGSLPFVLLCLGMEERSFRSPVLRLFLDLSLLSLVENKSNIGLSD